MNLSNIKTMKKELRLYSRCANLKPTSYYNIPDLTNPEKSNRYHYMQVFLDNGEKTQQFVPKKNKSIFKYMNLETALQCLKNKNIRFVLPTEWPDKFEGRFYQAKTNFNYPPSNSMFPNPVFCCCFTTNRTSEASWKTYSYEKSGLGEHVVQFELDFNALRDEFSKNVTDQFSIFEGPVFYRLSDYEIKNLHRFGKNKYRIRDFSLNSDVWNVDSSNWLPLLLIKRQQFYYENEIRFFLLANDNRNNHEEYVSIDWKRVIKQIYIDPKASDMEIEILINYCNQYDVPIGNNAGEIQITRANLYQMETNTPIEIIDF